MSKLLHALERTRGLVAPIVTWLDEHGSIDLEATGKHADHLLSNGCAGIFVAGTTGEFPYMTFDDKRALVSFMVNKLGSKAPVIAGISAPGTREAIQLGHMAAAEGATAAIAVLPQYFPLDVSDVRRYYDKVAGGLNGEIPLVLYHIPFVPAASHAITPELVFSLAKSGSIHGIKATLFDVEFLARLRQLLDGDFTVQCNIWPGTDAVTLECLRRGIAIDGAIIGSLNLFPSYYKALFKAYAEQPHNEAKCAVLDKVNGLIANLFAVDLRDLPGMVKAALHAFDLPFARWTGTFPPLPPVSDAIKTRTAAIMSQLASKGITP